MLGPIRRLMPDGGENWKLDGSGRIKMTCSGNNSGLGNNKAAPKT